MKHSIHCAGYRGAGRYDESLCDCKNRYGTAINNSKPNSDGTHSVTLITHNGNIVYERPQNALIIHPHHAKCIEALQLIALLSDTGTRQYKERFDGTCVENNGWRVADTMREIANDVVGMMPLSPIFQRENA